jgi:Tfp pilus assembly PilM family ATPase
LTRSRNETATRRLSRLVQTEFSAGEFSGGWSWETSRRKGAGLIRLFSPGDRFSVGVEFGEDSLRLAKIRHGRDRSAELVALRFAEIPDLRTGSADADRRLRAELKAFCAGSKKPEIWGVTHLKSAESNLANVPASGAKAGDEMAFWAIQEAKPFDEARTVFDYQIVVPISSGEDGGAAEADGVSASTMVGILGVTAEREEVDAVRRRFENAGFPLAGLSLYPLAFQNLIQAGVVRTGNRALCRLYVSENFSRIDVFSGSGALGFSRNIRSCVSSMVDVLRARLGAFSPPAEADGASPGEPRAPMDRKAARAAFAAMLEGRRPESGPAKDRSPAELLDLVEKPLQRLVWQVERTIEAYTAKIEGDAVPALCVAGDVAHSSLFREYLSGHVELPVSVESSEDIRIPGPLWPTEDPEVAFAEEPPIPFETFESAIGAGLARIEDSPNFVFHFRDKIRRTRGRRIQRWVRVFLVLCALATVAGYYWQRSEVLRRTETANRLERELADRIASQKGIRMDRALIELQANRLREEREAVRGIVSRYRMLAVVAGVTSVAPESIFFSNISIAFDGTIDGVASSADSVRASPRIVVEGHLVGRREETESELLRYMALLGRNAIFSRATLHGKIPADFQGDPALRFVIHLEPAGSGKA